MYKQTDPRRNNATIIAFSFYCKYTWKENLFLCRILNLVSLLKYITRISDKSQNTHTHTPAICNQKFTSQDTDMLKKVLNDLFWWKENNPWWRRKMHPYIKEKGHLLGKSYKSQPGSWHGSNSKSRTSQRRVKHKKQTKNKYIIN